MNVILGVTGSVAVFKSIILSRLLFKEGFNQKVILTQGALNFVKPLAYSSLTGADVYTDEDFFKANTHIDIAKWGDVLLVAPATANFISKLALGIADNLLLSVALAFSGRIIIAPAMHTEMWENPSVKENVEKLRERGVEILDPVVGELSSGDFGKGRMVEPEAIVSYLKRDTPKVLLVYGRTEEDIDDVRVITNRSSGRMGYEIHKALQSKGIPHRNVVVGCVRYFPENFVHLRTTKELLEYLKKNIPSFDVLIMLCAVSDFVPYKHEGKLDRRKGNISIELAPNVDVLRSLSSLKGNRLFVGFALERESNLLDRAYSKLKEKGLDLIVANTLSSMGSESISGMLIDSNGRIIMEFRKEPKSRFARKLVEYILSRVEEHLKFTDGGQGISDVR